MPKIRRSSNNSCFFIEIEKMGKEDFEYKNREGEGVELVSVRNKKRKKDV